MQPFIVPLTFFGVALAIFLRAVLSVYESCKSKTKIHATTVGLFSAAYAMFATLVLIMFLVILIVVVKYV